MKTNQYFLIAALGLAASSAQATLLLDDTFSYADGSLVGNTPATGGIWASHSGTLGDLQVVSGAVLVQHGIPSEDANSAIGSFSSGTLYYAMDLSVAGSTPTVTDAEYFAHFKDDGFDYTGRLSVEGPTAGGDFTLGIGGSADSQGIWGTDLTFGTTYRAVVGFDFTTGVSSLWVNPTAETDTSISGIADTVPLISSFALRQADSTWNEGITVDNLRVGTTFGDVLLPVPEPSAVVLSLLGAALLFRNLRKK